MRTALVILPAAFLSAVAASCASESAQSSGDAMTAQEVSVSCDAPSYSQKEYAPGERAQSQGELYECKPWPYSGWCGLGGPYTPGVGASWGDAWVLIGTCSVTVQDAGGPPSIDAGRDTGSTDGGMGADVGAGATQPDTKPPMGWNSWNKFGCRGISETVIKGIADALVNSGLAAGGYNTLTIDDCWSAMARDAAGSLQADAVKFPAGMKSLGDYIHHKGLRYGIYASIGTATCTGKTPGSVNNEARDVKTFASWGVDYIKADRCNADGLIMPEVYGRWHSAIVASGRAIVLSASDNGAVQEPWAWGPVTAQQWRTTGDIRDNWPRMLNMLDGNSKHPAATAPGSVNDPDMLEIGNGGMTDIEYRTHMGMWALMSAPLIAGNDVRALSAASKAILTQPEVLDVDHDALQYQAIKATDNGAGLQVWYKPVAASGARVVGLLNRSEQDATIAVRWTDIALGAGSATVRDLWARADRGAFSGTYSVAVPAHGLALLRVVGTEPPLATGSLSDRPWAYAAGAITKNKSAGGQALTLQGTTYASGFGVSAPAAIDFRPNRACSSFAADIGIDDDVATAGSVIFQIWGDGKKLYDSGLMTGASATKSIMVNLSGITDLRMQVVADDTTISDHGDWANARVVCGSP